MTYKPAPSKIDNSDSFTPATDEVLPIGALVDETATDKVAEGRLGAPRMSPSRVLYANPSDATGGTLVPSASEATARDAQLAFLLQSIAEALQFVAQDDTLRARGVNLAGETVDRLRLPMAISSLPLPPNAAQADKQPGLGTAGVPARDVLSIQGVYGGQPQAVAIVDEQDLLRSLGEKLDLLPQEDAGKRGDQLSTTPARAGLIVSTTAVRLVRANVARKELIISNAGGGTLYIGETNAVSSSGDAIGTPVPTSSSYTDSIPGIYVGELWGIYSASAVAVNVAVVERT